MRRRSRGACLLASWFPVERSLLAKELVNRTASSPPRVLARVQIPTASGLLLVGVRAETPTGRIHIRVGANLARGSLEWSNSPMAVGWGDAADAGNLLLLRAPAVEALAVDALAVDALNAPLEDSSSCGVSQNLAYAKGSHGPPRGDLEGPALALPKDGKFRHGYRACGTPVLKLRGLKITDFSADRESRWSIVLNLPFFGVLGLQKAAHY
ncbi:hypothetical protein GGP99_002865 [Salinibacter ruber]|uniref:Uncharacterized protein n=1 Tax=Salinibacter ruber TaxID=146919 RepID=A0AAW5PA09_9BACT|nr:hypothetical protein [Salinibacter ruber]MCS4222879.1 hypothetical protein [Salinibacter ruber]